jgi:hypothetical protein
MTVDHMEVAIIARGRYSGRIAWKESITSFSEVAGHHVLHSATVARRGARNWWPI